MLELAINTPVACETIHNLHGVVRKLNDDGTYQVEWNMGGYGFTSMYVERADLIECEWAADSEP